MITSIDIGITASKRGLSEDQKVKFAFALTRLKLFYDVIRLHHGDCIGGDAEADAIARKLGCEIYIHPPANSKLQAHCAQPGDVVYHPKEYLKRNADIVYCSKILFAGPKSLVEIQRSGTWATVRIARKRNLLKNSGEVKIIIL